MSAGALVPQFVRRLRLDSSPALSRAGPSAAFYGSS
jgi:hypothetical protein